MSEKNYEVLSTESGEFRTTFNKAYLNRKKWEPANPRHILSFMPGSVVEYDGVVKKIDAEVGANVPKDTLLIEFE